MSTFGGPGGRQLNTKPIPPERGSFPLDHYGECTESMMQYLSCVKKSKGNNNSECREIAKSYLACRMEKNLMAKDEFKNLGFDNDKVDSESSKSDEEKVEKGELRW
ncbi:Cytochrome c oxidase assembly protein COX19 [Golovinomyces cichoracearum]|uniref:Cytochrome c oxidase assembly protein COX19 n=1 Tax=Golovinomyces cichoracearum TaxID=62708 RepID=A0A420HPK3_9PEZI|nr:Cytochrome c oxidase assembly protein COX19 [Golovinomyces cichoracearum]